MSLARRTTNALIELVHDGILSWEDIARAALDYLSERDVEDLARVNDFLQDEDLDEDEDEDQ